MSQRSDVDLIDDILLCMNKIQQYILGLSYEEFESDFKTQDAIIRNLEIVGEASRKLSEDIKQKCHNIPWKAISGTRNRLIHGYFGVNIDIVWEIATVDIPDLKKEIEKMKSELYG